MSENTEYFKIKIGSNRNFGITFSIFFFILSIYLFVNENIFWLVFSILCCLFLFFSFYKHALLFPFNFLWFKFGILLGNLVAPIVMSLIFFLIFTPIGFLLKLFGKDLLKLKPSNKDTYWDERKETMNPFEDQF